MESKDLSIISKEWNRQIYTVLDLKELSLSEMNVLIRETYKVLTEYHTKDLVPKEMCQIFLRIDEFLHCAGTMEHCEKGKDFYHWEAFQYICDELKKGFFRSKYRAEYPQCIATDILDNDYLLDFSDDEILEKYIIAIEREKAKEP